ncbi:MAG: hypothetical protein J6M95_00680 [Bacilli bacterium]|nr:hypothetical protein [Bacilli bacterium]
MTTVVLLSTSCSVSLNVNESTLLSLNVTVSKPESTEVAYPPREINELISQKNVLNNKKITIANPEKRVQLIIDELRRFPKDDSIGDYDFRKLFKKVIIINRDRLIFVIGSDDMSKIPYNPNSIPMSFIETMDYKFRSRTFTTQFGILVNR